MSEPSAAEAYAPTLVSEIPDTVAVPVVRSDPGNRSLDPRDRSADRSHRSPDRRDRPRDRSDGSQLTVAHGVPKAPARRIRPAPPVASANATTVGGSNSAAAAAIASRPEVAWSPEGSAGPEVAASPEVAAGPEAALPLSPEPGKPPRKRHLHVVGENSRLRVAPEHRTRWLLSIAGVFAVAIAFGLVYLHVIAAQRQLPLDRLNTEVTQQEATYQRLRLEVAQLNSPSRIIPYVEGTLRMQEPSSPIFLAPTGPSGATAATADPSQAPAGEADWPQIKQVIAGTP